MGKIRVGLSGWSYDEWEEDFYTRGTSRDDRLAFIADRYETVEVNSTFYSLTTPSAVGSWMDETPSRFVFAVKGSRYITHSKRLLDPRGALANFFASGVLDLDGRLGPILWQLPPNLDYERDQLEHFLAMLPRDTKDAVALAREHDDRVAEVSYGDGENHRLRHVLEFRNPSFFTAEVMSLTQRHGCAVACSHSVEWPLTADVTAGFVYVRLHGPKELYASGYGDSELRLWAERAEIWRRGHDVDDLPSFSEAQPPDRKERDVFVYFDNTAAGHAPADAMKLMGMVHS